jgi:hypothetical protein
MHRLVACAHVRQHLNASSRRRLVDEAMCPTKFECSSDLQPPLRTSVTRPSHSLTDDSFAITSAKHRTHQGARVMSAASGTCLSCTAALHACAERGDVWHGEQRAVRPGVCRSADRCCGSDCDCGGRDRTTAIERAVPRRTDATQRLRCACHGRNDPRRLATEHRYPDARPRPRPAAPRGHLRERRRDAGRLRISECGQQSGCHHER